MEGKEKAEVETINHKEFACIGAVIRGGFYNIKYLQVMNYN